MKKYVLMVSFFVLSLFLIVSMGNAKQAGYAGYKKCGGCHKSQKKSWKDTVHKKSFTDLKAGKKVEAKKKAKLDPQKDYTKDEKCVGCHVTGFNKRGGYKIGLKKSKAKYVKSVGCEMCHGAGGLYRKEHRNAGGRHKKGKTTPRAKLVKLGMNVSTEAIENACYSCHMNYEGSGWDGAKEPYTPFTPKVDAKYKFDFDKAVKTEKGMHKHFKLKGVFTGEPKFKYHDEFQKNAEEGESAEE